ncbi:MAG: DUF2807 domain-containing protein, partial [Bacteroidales bacterium]|nr:DUF2807 domain-containing protein [Bacteroidales bacterium]
MKRLELIFTACVFVAATIACQAQRSTVSGNGNVKTEERNLPVFNGIRVASGIDVELTQGENQSVVVQTDENLMEHILTRVEGGLLRIYTEVNIRNAKSRRIKITMKDIRLLEASSAGDIEGMSPIKGDALRINISSAGDVEVEVDVNEIDIEISSSGDADISGSAGVMKAVISSAGDLNASELKTREADVRVSSSGDA